MLKDTDLIHFDPNNYRIHGDKNKRIIKKSLEDCGAGRSVLVDKDNILIAGNGVYEQAKELGINVRVIESDGTDLIVVKRTDISSEDEKRKLLALADNHASDTSVFDFDMVLNDFKTEDLDLWEFSISDIKIDLSEIKPDQGRVGNLKDKFIIPPFSILDTKLGQWQNRKKAWLALGIKSEAGRDEQITYARSAQSPKIYEVKNLLRDKKKSEPTWDEIIDFCKTNNIPLMDGTSIFDPVLCELAYRWFNISGGKILDPFAGGSVRGIVATKLDMPYRGVDLREEQIRANYENAIEIFGSDFGESRTHAGWLAGDSIDIDKHFNNLVVDMVFSCPPYADLEVYSDDPNDLSNMEYEDFIHAYATIIEKSCSMLKQDRFAVFVVGEVRDKRGIYRNFVGDTINAFCNAGLNYYNEMILVNQIGSLAMRAGKQFNSSRKIGKQHQNVLVFYKGDPKNIRDNFPELDLSQLDIFEEEK